MSNRTKLKSYFVTNAVPTAAQFAELIDSGLNPDEDSIKKLSAGPVALEAQGEATGPQEVLHFYKKFSDTDAAWKINLNGRTANAGLNISNAANQSRLFIKETDGSIGVGTSDPKAKLQIAGGNLYVDGKVGIGVANPNAPLSFTDAIGQKITLWGQSGNALYGFGIAPGSLQIHTDTLNSDVLFGYGSSAAFTETMRVKGNGNVGIGTKTPQAKLQVTGGAIMPAAGAKKDSGIYFPENAGGGGGDAAWICYYDRTTDGTVADTENMVLEIGIANDSNDHIALMPSGNVGINTTNPQLELHVNGAIVASGPGKTLGINSVVLSTEAAGGKLQTYNGQPLSINPEGNNVGIGTTDPKAKLHVAGAIHAGTSELYFTDINHGHTGFGNTIGYAAIENTSSHNCLMILGRSRPQGNSFIRYINLWDNVNVSGILTMNNAPVLSSDARIKQRVTSSIGDEDLELLNKLQVKEYFLKSIFGKKEKERGFIAQEVEQLLPEAVVKQTEFIADIFSQPAHVELHEETLTLTMPQEHGLITGDFVRLRLPTGTKDVYVSVADEKTFSISDWQEENIADILVYGKQVDDFRTLNYNTIFTLGISAIQELSRQVQQLKAEMKGLQEKLSAALIPAF